MNQVPRDPWPDATLPLLRDPYRYISRRCRRLGTDAFRTRLLGKPTLCVTGPEAARFFYEPGAFTREGAIPERIAGVLFGQDGIQRLDGERHHHRKALYLDLLTGPGLDDLDAAAADFWDAAALRFSKAEQIDVFPEMARVLTEAVCRWAGVPLKPSEVPATAEMLTSMFLHAAAVGPRHRQGVRMRRRAHDWARSHIRRARHDRAAGRRDAVSMIAGWQDVDGNAITADVAATELLSVLRPTVAVAVYVTFTVMALHRHPEHREAVAQDPEARHQFVQEVRRVYPFFPMTGAVSVRDLEWAGQPIPRGTRVLLDLYGTCRDPLAWSDPDRFLPERFDGWTGNPWTMIPQGGGTHGITHRCAGEWITIRLMELFAERFAGSDYDVLTPDAAPDYRTAPALPNGGVLLSNFSGRPASVGVPPG